MRSRSILTSIAAASVAAAAIPAAASADSLTATVIASGANLTHQTANGPAPLSGPDDIARLGDRLFVGFQNGVGSTGAPSATGNPDSTLVEFSRNGSVIGQWDLVGKIDGLGADPRTDTVYATTNEDGNSSIHVLQHGVVTNYRYDASTLTHGGGTDSVDVVDGHVLISASAPSSANGPAVYDARFDPNTSTVSLTPVFSDNSSATVANTGQSGSTTLALTDPDSSETVPYDVPRFAGDFMLDSQGDQQLIFLGRNAGLSVLNISQSIDDSAWATTSRGALYATDASANTLDRITGSFTPGTQYAAVTPCNANSAASTCTTPNSLGTVDMSSGAVTTVPVSGVSAIQPKGLLFIPAHGHGRGGEGGGQGGEGGDGQGGDHCDGPGNDRHDGGGRDHGRGAGRHHRG